jgi:DNA gyrase subunit B
MYFDLVICFIFSLFFIILIFKNTPFSMTNEKTLSHFKARAATYNKSSRWCTDSDLLQKIHQILSPKEESLILDTACGTGLVGKAFKGQVKGVIGIDITQEMYQQGRIHLNHIIHASAEQIPIKNHTFDISIERQGIQFMDALKAVCEMVRVTRPGGKVCLIQLCAYGQEDREEYFQILKLRNPARRNFFVQEDLRQLLENAGCLKVEVHPFISPEDVDIWADNGAITTKAREDIRTIYQKASSGFNRYHAVEIHQNGHIIDRMLFGIAVGTVP